MALEVRQTVTVQPGGIITLCSNNLPVGATVDVIVRIESEVTSLQGSLVSFIAAAKGNFATPTDVDQFIRQEREAWDF